MTEIPCNTDYFASCPKGIESLLKEELTELGAKVLRETSAGVHFSADTQVLYRCLFWTRLANRIFQPLASHKAPTAEDIYDLVSSISWESQLAEGASILVDFVGTNDHVTNSQFGAQKVKDAVVDRMVDSGKPRPQVSKQSPDVRINVRLTKSQTIVSLDLSGESLHRRGYRLRQGGAPLKENLAAAILKRAGWPDESKQAFVDPMCGSGTFLIEAAMMSANIAPGLLRKGFGVSRLLSFDDVMWRETVNHAESQKRPITDDFPVFYGFDSDSLMVQISRENIQAAGFSDVIQVEQKSVSDLELPDGAQSKTGLALCNPPYGERLGEVEELRGEYQILGQAAKRALSGWVLGVFTSNAELAKEMRLRAKNKYKFFNGKIPAELHLFDMLGAEANLRKDRNYTTDPLSSGAEMVRNRLLKNSRKLEKWRNKNDVHCYRLYDADMPEYAAAIDVYGDRYHVQEYQAPKSVNEKNAQKRFDELIHALVQGFELQPGQWVVKTRARQKGSDQYEKLGDNLSKHFFDIQENGVNLKVNLHDYLDTGLFLDHRPLRIRLQNECKGKSFLNLFCYTATATAHAVVGGAVRSVSVDLSNTYLAWAKDNFKLNNIRSSNHRLERADVVAWLAKCREGFDVIMLDPPSFSNSKNTKTVLDIQKDHVSLVRRCMELLNPGGILYFSNNLRSFKLDEVLCRHYDVKDISRDTIDLDFERNFKIHQCWRVQNK